jgi:hypothetical protein
VRRKLKNFKNKNGHSENGAPRQLVDEAVYREFRASMNYDSQYSGRSNPSRPRDQSISLRSANSAPPPPPSSNVT